MSCRFLRILAIAIAFGIGVPPAFAQSNALAEAKARDLFYSLSLRANDSLSSAKQRAHIAFSKLDQDKDGAVALSDAEAALKAEDADERARHIGNILRADADGDAVVTKEELELYYRERAREGDRIRNDGSRKDEEAIRSDVAGTMMADTNRDGKLTLKEIVDEAAYRAAITREERRERPNAEVRRLLVADLDNDGRVTLAEIDRSIEALFRLVDANGDGTISPSERDEFARQLKASAARDFAKACEMPPPSPNSIVVLLGAVRADALSTAAVGSQDTITTTGRIVVEPGSQPIYLVVVTSRPVIWRFSGAVERLERVVLTSALARSDSGERAAPPTVGSAGIPASRIVFHPTCIAIFARTPSPERDAAATAVGRFARREPSVVSGMTEASEFIVPSGIVRGRPRRDWYFSVDGNELSVIQRDRREIITRRGAALAEHMLRLVYPGGVVDVDPKSIVSSEIAEQYQVLPEHAGVLQLLKSGALTVGANGEYLIHRKIRLPPGGVSGHEKFVLLRGVPEPEGMLNYESEILSEETGRPIPVRRAPRLPLD